MKKLGFIAFGVAAVVGATTAATARADGTTPQTIAWGETVGDLQLGVRLDDKFRNFRVGEAAHFALEVRNVGQKTRIFTTVSPLSFQPFGTDEQAKALTTALKAPPPPVNYRFGKFTRSLTPGEQRVIDDADLIIAPSSQSPRYWALNAAPGNYRVGFGANFFAGQKAEGAPLKLKTGLLTLELTADSPPRSRFYLSEKTYTWGRESNGLQLGIRLEVPGQVIPATKPVPLRTRVRFDLAMRNVSDAPIEVTYAQGQWSISPRVTTEAGEQLSLGAQISLFGAARGGQVYIGNQTLEPGESADFGRAWLFVGEPTDKEYRDPVLYVEPGRYRVRYSYDFTPSYRPKTAVKDPKTGRMMVPAKDEADIPASEIILEVGPAAAPRK